MCPIVQGQARGYGRITRKGGCPEWAKTSNLNNSKMTHSFYEIFQDMKIWDICGHLQLVSSIFIKSSSNESILKNSFQIFVFGAWLKKLIFQKTSKSIPKSIPKGFQTEGKREWKIIITSINKR